MRKTLAVTALVLWTFLMVTGIARAQDGDIAPASPELTQQQTVDKPEYLLFVPEGLDPSRKYPLIVAFSPSANASGMISSWKDLATRYQCLVYASKVVRNGMDVPPVLKRIHEEHLPEIKKEWPVARGAAITTGVSGGGMTAHLYAFFCPMDVAAVISQVGYIHENSLKKVKRYPKGKIAALLTSPTDFNFKLISEDVKYLNKLGWQVRLWEHEKGHSRAPAEMVEEALEWVLQQDSIAKLLR